MIIESYSPAPRRQSFGSAARAVKAAERKAATQLPTAVPGPVKVFAPAGIASNGMLLTRFELQHRETGGFPPYEK